MTDENWVERLSADGERRERALEELREILLRGVSAVARKQFSTKLQVEDVVQDALVKILEKRDTFQGRSKFTTWAMTIAIRIAIRESRQKQFQDVSMDQLLGNNMQFEPPSQNGTPAEQLGQEKAQLLDKLKELIETRLSEKQRNAVHALLNGMPVEVFAEKTSSNRSAVYKLVHDARVKLRQGFEEAGFLAEDVKSVFA